MIKKLLILYYYLMNKYYYKFILTNPNRLEKHQVRGLKKHVKFLNKRSLFYENLTADMEIEYMTKEIMMANFDSINTVNVTLENVISTAIEAEKTRKFESKIGNISVGLSSGTSGNRGVFVSSEAEQARWAGSILSKVLYKGLFAKYRIAFFMRADNNLYKSASNNRINIRFYHLLDDYDNNIKDLDKYSPNILIAQPSMLIKIAEYVEAKKIDIQPIKIISIAELLEDTDKQFLETVLKQKIHQIYQATEGFLACTCKCGNLHLNEENIIFKKLYLDQERYHPIIIDFTRKSQPIINYVLNDILIDDILPCACGSKARVVKKIEGRMDDVFVFYSEEGKEHLIFPDFIRNALIKAHPSIRDYQVTQIRNDGISIYVSVEDGFDLVEVKGKIIESISCLLKTVLNEEFSEIQLEFTEVLNHSTDRKFKRIISNVIKKPTTNQ